jgi:HlyD family secretion protein
MDMTFRLLTRFTPRRSRRARLLAAGLVLAAAGAALAGCRRGGETAQTDVMRAQPASTEKIATQVSALPAHVAAITQTLEVTGALNTLHDVTVGAKAAGRVAGVFAREGDPVRAGQVVAVQDTADLQAQLDQQRANLLTAKTKLDQARVIYKNAQTTLKWTQDQTDSAVRLAQAGLESATEQAAVVRLGAREQERQQAREAVSAAKSERDRARADREKARSDLKRYQDLYRQEAVSAQQLDQAQSVADASDAAYNAADARYNSAMQAEALIKEGARPEDLRRAQAAVDQANQSLVAAQSNRDQVKLRRADVENARVGIQAAEAGVRQAEAAVRLSEQALKDASIISPIEGVVAERRIEPGMQLGAGKDVMRIVALHNSIYFDAQLSETQSAQVRIGQPVTVTVDSQPGTPLRGLVAKIFPVASPTARSFTMRITIASEGKLLRPNQFARGRITLAAHPHAIVVPREAVLDVNDSTGRVFVVVHGKAEERKVTLGFSNLHDVEITQGVQAGDLVVTVGQAQLQNGDKIQVGGTNNTVRSPQSTGTAGR